MLVETAEIYINLSFRCLTTWNRKQPMKDPRVLILGNISALTTFKHKRSVNTSACF